MNSLPDAQRQVEEFIMRLGGIDEICAEAKVGPAFGQEH